MPNHLTNFAVKTLREYADECSTTVRGTSDISPLEEWLITRLFNEQEKNKPGKCFVLISITSTSRQPELVSRSKDSIETRLKESGYYWSENLNKWINDIPNRPVKVGSAVDYVIHEFTEIY
jgi:hypothetical protein